MLFWVCIRVKGLVVGCAIEFKEEMKRTIVHQEGHQGLQWECVQLTLESVAGNVHVCCFSLGVCESFERWMEDEYRENANHGFLKFVCVCMCVSRQTYLWIMFFPVSVLKCPCRYWQVSPQVPPQGNPPYLSSISFLFFASMCVSLQSGRGRNDCRCGVAQLGTVLWRLLSIPVGAVLLAAQQAHHLLSVRAKWNKGVEIHGRQTWNY